MSRSPVVLVHSNRLFLEGLARICESGQFRLRYAGAGWDCFAADVCNSEQVPVFIVGGHNPAATVSSIRGEYGFALIVVVGESGESDEIAQALTAGANCYLRETTNSDLLLKTLDLLTQNEVIFSPQLIRQSPPCVNGDNGDSCSTRNLAAKEAAIPLVIHGNGATPPSMQSNGELPPDTKLSARETIILEGLVEGDSNKVIANRLHITEATVKVHVKAILRKIRVKNRTQAAIWAVKHLPAHIRVGGDLFSAAADSGLKPH